MHLVELEGVLAVEVEQAAGRRDKDIDAAAQAHHLRVDADAAVGRVGADAGVFAVLAEAGVDLFGQFARRHQHKGAHGVAADLDAIGGQAVQDGQREAGGLAGAGLGCGHQVAPF